MRAVLFCVVLVAANAASLNRLARNDLAKWNDAVLLLDLRDNDPVLVPNPFPRTEKRLNETEKEALHSLLADAYDRTKRDFRNKLEEFVKSLEDEVRAAAEDEFYEGKARWFVIAHEVKLLSKASQDIFFELVHIVAIKEDTFREQDEKVEEMLKSADKAGLDELAECHIPLPGVNPQNPTQPTATPSPDY